MEMLNKDKDVLCRLCRKQCNDGFNAIETDTKKILTILLLNLDLTLTEDRMICESCSENLQRFFHFKLACLSVEKDVKFLPNKESLKIDLSQVYVNKNRANSYKSKNNICRLCMQLAQYPIYLNYEEKDAVLIMLKLEKFFPEVDLSISENPGICLSCYNLLLEYFTFMTTCLETEEKIKVYIELQEADNKSEVKLHYVAQFMSNTMLGCKNGYAKIDKAIKEEENLEDTDIKYENAVEAENEGLTLKPEEVIIKTCFNDSDELETCTSSSMTEMNLHSNRSDSPEIKHHKCDICNYATNRKHKLKIHILSHQDPNLKLFQCKECGYQTRYRRCLSRHLLTHKDASNLKMYKCKLCPLQTKYKSGINQHMLIHKNASEVKMYKCQVCTYESKRKNDLNKHVLTHKNSSEVTMYQCETCKFETKRKEYLLTHVRLHKGTPNNPIYKCDQCQYETKDKKCLKQHSFVHRDVSEITMYTCEICGHESKRKSYLMRHMITHQTGSDVILFKCEFCPHQTKYKNSFKKHMLVHKKKSEVTMYKCEVCRYESRYKQALLRHLLTHKDVRDEKTYVEFGMD